jgi:hypothetical protein
MIIENHFSYLFSARYIQNTTENDHSKNNLCKIIPAHQCNRPKLDFKQVNEAQLQEAQKET